MVYDPHLTYCPLCRQIKSPLASLCQACYLKARAAGCNNTGDIQAWLKSMPGEAR
jgi:hypothetical protein